jgi:hypothetical protein
MNKHYVFGALLFVILASCQGDTQCELRLKSLQEIRDNGLVVIDPGYLKGSEFVQLAWQAQQHYLDGIVDGIRLAPFFGAYDQTYPDSKLRTLLYCIATWGNDRKAVVDDYVLAHPEKHKHSAHILVNVALLESCNAIIENCRDTTCQGYSTI